MSNVQLHAWMKTFSSYVHQTYYIDLDPGLWEKKGQIFGYHASHRINQKRKSRDQVLFRFHWLDGSDVLYFRLDSGSSSDSEKFKSIFTDLLSFLSDQNANCLVTSDRQTCHYIGEKNAELASLTEYFWKRYHKPKGVHNFTFRPRTELSNIEVIAKQQRYTMLSSMRSVDQFCLEIRSIVSQMKVFKNDVFEHVQSLVPIDTIEVVDNANKFYLYGALIHFRARHDLSQDLKQPFRIRIADRIFSSDTLPDPLQWAEYIVSYAKKSRLVHLFN